MAQRVDFSGEKGMILDDGWLKRHGFWLVFGHAAFYYQKK
jgi:hypothetical protein